MKIFQRNLLHSDRSIDWREKKPNSQIDFNRWQLCFGTLFLIPLLFCSFCILHGILSLSLTKQSNKHKTGTIFETQRKILFSLFFLFSKSSLCSSSSLQLTNELKNDIVGILMWFVYFSIPKTFRCRCVSFSFASLVFFCCLFDFVSSSFSSSGSGSGSSSSLSILFYRFINHQIIIPNSPHSLFVFVSFFFFWTKRRNTQPAHTHTHSHTLEQKSN